MKKIFFLSMITIGIACFFIPAPVKSAIVSKKNTPMIKDSTSYEINGVLVSKNKSLVKLKMDPTDLMPQVDQTGVLSKYFENKIGNMNISGWLNIADIKIVSVTGLDVTVLVEKELSVTYVNGEKKNHFKAGNQIKITWVVKD